VYRSWLLATPEIRHRHAPILITPLWCVVGRNGLARTVTNRLDTLGRNLEALREILFNALDAPFGELLVFALVALAIRVSFKLDAIVEILWLAQHCAELVNFGVRRRRHCG